MVEVEFSMIDQKKRLAVEESETDANERYQYDWDPQEHPTDGDTAGYVTFLCTYSATRSAASLSNCPWPFWPLSKKFAKGLNDAMLIGVAAKDGISKKRIDFSCLLCCGGQAVPLSVLRRSLLLAFWLRLPHDSRKVYWSVHQRAPEYSACTS